MKVRDDWRPTKYIRNPSGQLIASRDSNEVASSSRLVADLTAKWYDTSINDFAKGELLDLGCGKAPLYSTYAPLVSGIVLADWDNSQHKNTLLDVTCDITKTLPFNNSSFDTIILSDVLEHIPNPYDLMAEIERILRPDGVVLMNTPFLYWLHETPYDYNRYTEYMLKKLIEDSSLEVVKIEPLAGAYAVLIDLLLKIWRGKLIGIVPQILSKLLSKKLNDHKRFPLAYTTVFRKSVGEGPYEN